MAGYFGGSSSGGGGYFGGSGGRSSFSFSSSNRVPARETKGSFLGNLLNDIKNTVVGLPRGVKEFVTHPIETTKATIQAYKTMYGPLFHGDFDKFWERVHANPLQPILDAVSLVPGIGWGIRGASMGGRAARLLGPESKFVKFAEPEGKVRTYKVGDRTVQGRAFSANPLTRKRQELFHAGQKNIVPSGFWRYGEKAQHAKYARREENRLVARDRIALSRAQRAVGPLTAHEQQVVSLRARLQTPDSYREVQQRAFDAGEVPEQYHGMIAKNMEAMDNAELRGLFEKVDKEIADGKPGKEAQRILEAENALRALSLEDARIYHEHGLATVEDLLDRPYDAIRLERGARKLGYGAIEKYIRAAHTARSKLETEVARQTAKVERISNRIEKKHGANEETTAKKLAATRAHIADAVVMRRRTRQEADQHYREMEELDREIGRQNQGKAATRRELAKNRTDAASLEPEIQAAQQRINYYNAVQDMTDGWRAERIAPLEARIEGLRARQRAIINDRYVTDRDLMRMIQRHENMAREWERKKMYEQGLIDEIAELRKREDALEHEHGQVNPLKKQQAIDAELKDEIAELERLRERRRQVRFRVNELRTMAPGWYRDHESWESVGRDVSREELIESLGTDRRPFYMPDTMVPSNLTGKIGQAVNKGQAQLWGLVALGKETLTAKFANDSAVASSMRSSQLLYESAVKHDASNPMPRGMTWLIAPPSHTAKNAREWAENAVALFEPIDATKPLKNQPKAKALMDEFRSRTVTDNEAERLVLPGGEGLIVPKKLVDSMAKEHANAKIAGAAVFERTMSVWRTVLLGYSPRFFVNNFVGNHFLYALNFGGYYGIRAYIDELRKKDAPRAKALLSEMASKDFDTNNPDVPWAAAMVEHFFAEQMGGFADQNLDWYKAFQGALPEGSKRTKWAKRMHRARFGLLPVAANWTEYNLRRAGIITQLRKSPEVRAQMAKMKGETEVFERAATIALNENPQLVKQIAQEIDDSLGNYSEMSPFERTVLRNAMPFYSWYRAITTIALRLPQRHPMRALFVAHLGMIGYEMQRDEHEGWASYLLGNIDLPDWLPEIVPGWDPAEGRTPQLATSGLNPFATIDQLISAGQSFGFLPGGEGLEKAQGLGITNPFLQAFYEGLSGKKVLTGAPVDMGPLGERAGVFGYLLEKPFLSLPQIEAARRAGREDTGETLYDPGGERAGLNLFGLPVRATNPERAEELGRKEFIAAWKATPEGIAWTEEQKRKRERGSNASSGPFKFTFGG